MGHCSPSPRAVDLVFAANPKATIAEPICEALKLSSAGTGDAGNSKGLSRDLSRLLYFPRRSFGTSPARQRLPKRALP
jgi:hypothetical protein